jgi:hypothetical protein
MPDNIGIEELMITLNTDPTADDHEPEVPEEKPEVAAVTDLAAKFTASLTDMTANQKLIFDSLLGQMEKNNTSAVAAPAQKPASAPTPEYTPNPALEPMKTFDPDSYAVLVAKDKADFEANLARDQRLMSIINKQTDQIDDLIKANNNNLGYLEESVVGAKHADAATLTKTPEFMAWIDGQNPIVKDAYKNVLETGTPANRIQLLDMFKEQAVIDKDAAALSAATKGAEVEKTKLPAPGSLTDFESSKRENANVSLLELALDPDRVNAYLATANGDPIQIQKLSEKLAEAIAAEM